MYYRIELDAKEYVGPHFSCIEEAIMWAQSMGYITYDEDTKEFDGSRIEVVEFEK